MLADRQLARARKRTNEAATTRKGAKQEQQGHKNDLTDL
jgi:hypothetical protein